MIDNFLAVHARSLKLRAQRTNMLATNIANADTPNYKARDMAFAEVMRDVSGASPTARSNLALKGGSMAVTDSRHIRAKTSMTQSAPVMYRQPEQASLDGNTVDKDMEQARFAENAVRYQASLNFINSRVSGLIRTLRSE